MSWSSLLKATFKYGGRAAKATASSVGSAVIHPQRTIKGLGTATKTAAVGGAAAYVGWEKLTTDKSVARIVGDAVVGSDTIDTVSDKVDGVANTVTELKDSVGGAVDTMNNAMTSVDSKWSGMSNFLRGVFSGNGGDMFATEAICSVTSSATLAKAMCQVSALQDWYFQPCLFSDVSDGSER